MNIWLWIFAALSAFLAVPIVIGRYLHHINTPADQYTNLDP